MSEKPFATCTEAAQELGLSARRIRALCEQGRVHGAIKVGRDWLIPRPIRIEPARKGPKPSWDR